MGWQVETVDAPGALAGADLAVVVNPNNPDGRRHRPDDLAALAADVALLVVDESFADPEPDVSLLPRLGHDSANLVVLRSFGKFYGLAGVRLGFAVTGAALAERFRALAGPWAVSGPAIASGRAALADRAWQEATTRRLVADARRLDALADAAGWRRARMNVQRSSIASSISLMLRSRSRIAVAAAASRSISTCSAASICSSTRPPIASTRRRTSSISLLNWREMCWERCRRSMEPGLGIRNWGLVKSNRAERKPRASRNDR